MPARRASELATPDDIANLMAMHHLLLEATEAHDFRRTTDLNWNLHRSINRLARSRKILSAIRQVSPDLPRNFLIEDPEWSAKSKRDHDQILAKMAARSHEGVKTAMTPHVVTTGQKLIEYLESEGRSFS